MKTADITEREGALFIKRDLNKLIFPLIIEQILAISVGMFDTMMISSLGDCAVSGVSLVDMINVLMINFFSALATGGAVVCAHEVGLVRSTEGESDFSKARHFGKQLMAVLFIISVSVAVVCFFLRAQILSLVFGNEQPEVLLNARVYFAISAISYPFIALYNGFAALFRTMGNSRVTMITSMIINLVNVGCNALFIYVFDFGVAGAAWSSAISRMLGMAILAVLIMNKKGIIYIDFKERFFPDTAAMGRILRIGVPGGLENSIFNLGRIVAIRMMTVFGASQLAANAIANNIDQLSVVPGIAVGLAVVTVVGQCIGAGDYEAARAYHKKLLKISYLSVGGFSIAILLALPLILKLYSASDDAIKLASLLINIHLGVGIFLWPPSFTTPNSLRAAKDVRFTMVVAIFSMVTFRIVLSYVFGVRMGMGILGVWLAMLVDWVFRAILFNTRIWSGKWLSKVKEKERV